MKSDSLKFLNDDEFYRWMAVCDKECRSSENLLVTASTAYARKQHLCGNDKQIKKCVLGYIAKNLKPEEFERYVKKTQKASIDPIFLEEETTQDRMKNIRTGAYSKANRNKVDIVKYELIDRQILDKKPDDVKSNEINVDDVKFDEVKLPVVEEVKLQVIEEIKLPTVEEVKLPTVEEEQIIKLDNETLEKFEIFKKMIGGNMKEGSR